MWTEALTHVKNDHLSGLCICQQLLLFIKTSKYEEEMWSQQLAAYRPLYQMSYFCVWQGLTEAELIEHKAFDVTLLPVRCIAKETVIEQKNKWNFKGHYWSARCHSVSLNMINIWTTAWRKKKSYQWLSTDNYLIFSFFEKFGTQALLPNLHWMLHANWIFFQLHNYGRRVPSFFQSVAICLTGRG